MNLRWRTRSFSAGALATLAAIVFVAPASPAHPMVAAVSIGIPVDSLASRERIAQSREHVSANASPGRAWLLSIGATALPVATGIALMERSHSDNDVVGGLLAAGGILVGPAAGYIDAGLVRRGTRGMLVRTGIVAVSFAAMAGAALASDGGLDDLGLLLVPVAGASFATVIAIGDCARVGSEVSHASRPAVAIVPGYARGGPRVAVALRF